MIPQRILRVAVLALLFPGGLVSTIARAQTPAQTRAGKMAALDGHLVWVMPFQNNSSQPGLDWIGASFPDILNQRLTAAGFLTIRREDRQYALTHLGLPADFHPTEATAYRIAQTLDADTVVFGRYQVANGQITASARVLIMSGPRMNRPIEVRGRLDQLIDLEDELAWKVAARIAPELKLDEQTFLAAGRDLRLDAFENYIRGEVDPEIAGRIAHLSRAVALSPAYTEAWFALGRAYFENQQYEEALAPFSKVPRNTQLWLETMFYSGLSHLYTGNYSQAQSDFAAIAALLPMPEVLNNEGIAISRRGENGTAFFERVVQLDPQNADYWFNLAVSERRRKNYGAAQKAVERALALKPQDTEAARLKRNLAELKAGPTAAATKPVSTKPVESPASPDTADSTDTPVESAAAAQAEYEPLERIARGYDESSFRQAAFEMEQMDGLKLASMPAPARAKLLAAQGTEYMQGGLLLEAERQFQLAVAADPASAAGYAGLAEVHEDAGSVKIAQSEAAKSLAFKPNAPAYLVLARLALASRDSTTAEKNAEQALALEPGNTAARGILQAAHAQPAKPTVPTAQ